MHYLPMFNKIRCRCEIFVKLCEKPRCEIRRLVTCKLSCMVLIIVIKKYWLIWDLVEKYMNQAFEMTDDKGPWE